MAANGAGFLRAAAGALLRPSGHMSAVKPYAVSCAVQGLLLLGAGLSLIGTTGKRGWQSQDAGPLMATLFEACLVVTPPLLGMILIYPHAHYLVLFMIPLVCLLVPAIAPITPRTGRATLYVVMAMGLVLVGQSSAAGLKAGEGGVLRTRTTLDALASLKLSGELRMLEADGGYWVYLPGRVTWTPAYGKSAAFDTFRAEHRINIIVVDDALLSDSRFRTDPEWRKFLNDYAAAGFCRKELPVPGTYLLVDKALIHQPSDVPAHEPE